MSPGTSHGRKIAGLKESTLGERRYARASAPRGVGLSESSTCLGRCYESNGQRSRVQVPEHPRDATAIVDRTRFQSESEQMHPAVRAATRSRRLRGWLSKGCRARAACCERLHVVGQRLRLPLDGSAVVGAEVELLELCRRVVVRCAGDRRGLGSPVGWLWTVSRRFWHNPAGPPTGAGR